MPNDTAPMNFTRRDTRFAVVKELVNDIVPDLDSRIMILHAVSEYGHAAAMEALDGAKSAIRDVYGKPESSFSVADVLDEAQDRR